MSDALAVIDVGRRYRFTIEGTVINAGLLVADAFGFEHQLCADGKLTIEAIDPPGWPPRPGEIWKDKDGHRWFCQLADQGTWCLRGEEIGQLVARDETRKLAELGLQIVTPR